MSSLESKALQNASERAFLAVAMSFLAYGVNLTIALSSIYWIYKTKGRNTIHRQQITFVVALIILSTFNISLWSANTVKALQAMLMSAEEVQRISLDLPASFIVQGSGASATALAITTLCNGFLVFRCYIIWGKGLLVSVPLATIYLGTIATGIFDVSIYWRHLHQEGLNGPVIAVQRATKAYWALILSLNGLTTLLIVLRILWKRRTVVRNVGKEHGKTYVGIAAYLLESACIYSIAAILGFALNWWIYGPLATVPQASLILLSLEITPFNPYLAHVECIASELIILRVALGRAWTHTTASTTNGSDWRARSGTTIQSGLGHNARTPHIAINLSPRLPSRNGGTKSTTSSDFSASH